MRQNSLIRILAINVAILLGLLALLELGARLVLGSNTVLNVNLGGLKEYHPTRGAALKPNYEAGDIRINSKGILGPEFEIQRDPDQIRILCIGDSVTFSPPAGNYCRRLEEILESRFADTEFETIVGAVPGYSSYEALDWNEEFLNQLDPDIATIYLGWNDMGQFHPFGLRYKNERLYQEQTAFGWLMSHSYAARFPYFFAGRFERSRPVDMSPPTESESAVMDAFYPTHYEENLETLIRNLEGNGTRPYLVSLTGLVSYDESEQEVQLMHFPRNLGKKLSLYQGIYEKYQLALHNVASSTDTPIVDLTERVRDEDRLKIFTDTMHITPYGAALYAESIADELDNQISLLVAKSRQGGS